jgi:hypothetical protein
VQSPRRDCAASVPHDLIDLLELHAEFNVAQYPRGSRSVASGCAIKIGLIDFGFATLDFGFNPNSLIFHSPLAPLLFIAVGQGSRDSAPCDFS